jgi:hypothetical protein
MANRGEARVGRRKQHWWALIPDTHEGYISWEQHQQILRMMSDNNYGGEQTGAAKRGSALLAGIDRVLISGTSSTRGAFRVRMPVDDVMVNELRSRGVVVEFETSSNLIP